MSERQALLNVGERIDYKAMREWQVASRKAIRELAKAKRDKLRELNRQITAEIKAALKESDARVVEHFKNIASCRRRSRPAHERTDRRIHRVVTGRNAHGLARTASWAEAGDY